MTGCPEGACWGWTPAWLVVAALGNRPVSHAIPEVLDDGYKHILKQGDVFEFATVVYVICDPLLGQG